jgi:phospho-N-acetylmuramoyl-pentapeptide-transferase
VNTLVNVVALALLISAVAAAPIMSLLLRLRSRQTVSQFVQEHAHKQGTPTMGGLIIVTGLVGTLLIGARTSPVLCAELVVFIVGFAAIGFFDDWVIPRMFPGKRGLGWTQKLGLQFFTAIVTLLPFARTFDPVSLAVAVLVVLFFANAYNFADGLDWLAGSILFAFGFGIFGLNHWSDRSTICYVMAATLGAAVPFMVLNRPKAKVFMGDVGSMAIGALLGLIVMAMVWPSVAPQLADIPNATSSFDSRILIPVILLSLVMMAELVPVPLQILSVKLRGKRLFPCTPIHHAYQRAGMKETRVVAWFFAAQLACSVAAIALKTMEDGQRQSVAIGQVGSKP